MVRPVPAISCASTERPLAAASSSTVRPSVAATDERLSPGAITCVNSDALVGNTAREVAAMTAMTRREGGVIPEGRRSYVKAEECNGASRTQDFVLAFTARA